MGVMLRGVPLQRLDEVYAFLAVVEYLEFEFQAALPERFANQEHIRFRVLDEHNAK